MICGPERDVVDVVDVVVVVVSAVLVAFAPVLVHPCVVHGAAVALDPVVAVGDPGIARGDLAPANSTR